MHRRMRCPAVNMPGAESKSFAPGRGSYTKARSDAALRPAANVPGIEPNFVLGRDAYDTLP